MIRVKMSTGDEFFGTWDKDHSIFYTEDGRTLTLYMMHIVLEENLS